MNKDGKPDLITANFTSFTNSRPVDDGQFIFGLGHTLSILLNTSNFVNTLVLQTAPNNLADHLRPELPDRQRRGLPMRRASL